MYIAIIIFLLAVWVIMTYNRALSWKLKVENSLSQIDVQLKAKAEKIPNLVETAKKYAEHELEVYDKTTELRSQLLNAVSVEDAVKIDDKLNHSINKIFAVSEGYPNLKADKLFLEIQNQIREIENTIAAYRQFYNDTVMLNNRYLQLFPNNIVLKLFGFKEKGYLKFDVVD